MSQRSTITELPADLKAWLDRELIKRGFSGYEELARIIRGQGHKASKSAIHRYGQQLEARQAGIKASVEAAKAIVAESEDAEGAMSQALLNLTQEKIFSMFMELQEELTPKQLSNIALAVDRSVRANVNQKRFAEEVREKVKRADEAVAKIAKKGGLSKKAADEIRSQILGIAK